MSSQTPPSTSSEIPQTPSEYEAQRRKNRDAITALGLQPYGRRTEGLSSVAQAKSAYDPVADEDAAKNGKTPGFVDRRPTTKIAGRVVLSRDNGKLIWMNLRDHTGDIQIAVSQRDVSATEFSLAKLLDLSDVVVAEGRLMKTRTGEITVWCTSLSIGCKSLVPPPAKHEGLTDQEIRYRQRYVDLWANPETLRTFLLRSSIVSRMRQFLVQHGYTEVETPMLQALAGGAAARPFITKMNALNINLYMRIAPELYLKRLLVGGMPKVFEINRNFRNEGLDKQHNPEFTMLEAYHAFGDVETVMNLTESLIRDSAVGIAEQVVGPGAPPVLPFGDLTIDYGRPFERIAYPDLFERAMGYPITNIDRARKDLRERLPQHAAQAEKADPALVINELFEAFAEGLVDHARPTFITDYPAAISPLTRAKPDNPNLADRADLFIAGMEIAPHYTELNDPDVQESRFREQLSALEPGKGAEESTFRTMDHDFIRALKVGMPPAGGMGLGVDRLAMLLTNQRTIRDVVLFPLMRPEE